MLIFLPLGPTHVRLEIIGGKENALLPFGLD